MIPPATGAAGVAIAAPAADPKTQAAQKKDHELRVAAREFEAIFVRSLLKNSPMAGKGDAYGDMAVDALATSVTAGRGLGLGDLIRNAVEKADQALKKPG